MGEPQPKLTLDDFMVWENDQPTRNFYYRGEVFAMVGVRQAHATVTLNLGATLKTALRGTPCRAFVADMKLRIDAADLIFYPDVIVTCDPRDRATPMHLAFPRLIVEVLSPSTEKYDRADKFAFCRRLETLAEYVLVDIDARRTEVFRKNPEGLWVLHEFHGAQTVEFASVGVTVPAEALYENVEAA